MKYIEFVGKNADDAVRQASRELGISKDKLKYDVVSYGSTGIFGLVGSKKAKIRVHSLDSYPKTKVKQAEDRTIDEEKDEEKKEMDEAPKPSQEIEEPEHTELEEKPKPVEIDEDDGVRVDGDKAVSVDEDEGDTDDPLLSDEYVQKGYSVLKRIVDAITEDAKVTLSARRGQIYFHIQGGNTAVLIGKHGQSLDAMQFLIDKIVNKTRFKQKVRIRIDIEGYLRIREENLTKLALRLADKVKKTQRSETVSPMNAHDRRIIHLALKDDSTLKTQSIGSGYYRKLVIFPYRGRNDDE
jgi:spoIIIJ-associated protein